MKKRLRVAGKSISLFTAEGPSRPIIYLHSFMPNWDLVRRACLSLDCPPFSLAIISGLNWGDEMTPWYIPPTFRGDSPCGGTADTYLKLLEDEIIPSVESELPVPATYRGLAGYSLSGLFAVYAPFKTDLFARVASASGSMWYPKFTDYVSSHEMVRKPDCVYLSLGEKEAKTKNEYYKPVQERTEWLNNYYSEHGVASTFELNPGGHDHNATGRMAKAINWILNY